MKFNSFKVLDKTINCLPVRAGGVSTIMKKLHRSAKLWVNALRSNKYKQGIGFLCNNNTYCCLGVACQLYNRYHPKNKLKININTKYKVKNYDQECVILPEKVRKWLKLRTSDGQFVNDQLTRLNDSGRSFDTIANIIESQPKGLFYEN